jgi:hypothetical protein
MGRIYARVDYRYYSGTTGPEGTPGLYFRKIDGLDCRLIDVSMPCRRSVVRNRGSVSKTGRRGPGLRGDLQEQVGFGVYNANLSQQLFNQCGYRGQGPGRHYASPLYSSILCVVHGRPNDPAPDADC